MARGFTLALCCIGNAIAFLPRTHLSAPTSLRSADADDYPSDATEPVEAAPAAEAKTALVTLMHASPPVLPPPRLLLTLHVLPAARHFVVAGAVADLVLAALVVLQDLRGARGSSRFPKCVVSIRACFHRLYTCVHH